MLATAMVGEARRGAIHIGGGGVVDFYRLGVITYLAGFATISEELLEAATLDGAGFWTQLFSIILPLMRPVIGYWTILCTGGPVYLDVPLHPCPDPGRTGLPAPCSGIPGVCDRLPLRGARYATAIGVVLFLFVLSFSFFQVRQMYMAGTGTSSE